MKFKKNILFVVLLIITISAYGQIDSIETRTLYSWKLNTYDLSIDLVEMDTSLNSFQNFNPLLKNTITSNYLGNLGSAAQSKIYYDRSKFKTGFIFSEPYGIYFHNPKEHVYFNTKRQFTLLNYSNAGPKEESEQVLGVVHTQNINKDFNVGVDYDMISSEGRYYNQQIRQNNLTFFTSYRNSGYRVHSNFTLNRVKAQENGGIDSLYYLGDKEYKKRKNIPVKLEDAASQVLSTSFYLAHEYTFGRKIIVEEVEEAADNIENTPPVKQKGMIGKEGLSIGDTLGIEINDSTEIEIVDSLGVASFETDSTVFNNDSLNIPIQKSTKTVVKLSGFSLSHELIYNQDVRKYSDNTLVDSFYNARDIYIDSTTTADSVKQWQFGNRFSMHYKHTDNFSARLSFYNEQMTYKSNIKMKIDSSGIINDTTRNYRAHHSNSNMSFFLRAKLFDKILFSGYGEYYINGYKKENSKVNLKFGYIVGRNTEVSLKGNYYNKYPDQFYKKFTSNHFDWDNGNLWRIEEWDAGLYIENRKYKLDANIRYGQISNYLYLDSTAYVNQYDGQINILSGELSKRIKLGPINTVTRFVYQKCTNDSVLSLPEYNLYQSLYFERLFNFESTGGKLLIQAGVDYRFASSFMADGYMPVTGLFYRQFEHEQEDYHCFDLFANFTVKRARLYFKWNYINSRINKKYYFTGPFYPSPEPIFKFGLAWTFYD